MIELKASSKTEVKSDWIELRISGMIELKASSKTIGKSEHYRKNDEGRIKKEVKDLDFAGDRIKTFRLVT